MDQHTFAQEASFDAIKHPQLGISSCKLTRTVLVGCNLHACGSLVTNKTFSISLLSFERSRT